MKYILKNTKGKKIKVTIDESVKEDFKKLMNWSEEKFLNHTEEIKEPDNRRNWQIWRAIQFLIGINADDYDESIKYNAFTKEELLKLEKAIKVFIKKIKNQP